ncbi:unnamed protein product [Linum trigynum]|uniref:Uncharacterized protein n=1 Tax=Linum trigynum TaxID=586398 RepID=A0AAV2CIQ7_9ROSI
MSDGAAVDEHFVEGDRESSVVAVDNHGTGVAFAGANWWRFVFSIGPMVTNDDGARTYLRRMASILTTMAPRAAM